MNMSIGFMKPKPFSLKPRNQFERYKSNLAVIKMECLYMFRLPLTNEYINQCGYNTIGRLW